ncbi:AAA family ATPase [Azospirillum sp. sgz302134]
MFDPVQLQPLLERNREGLARLGRVEDLLNERFADLEEQVRAMILAVASGEPLLFVGPPGTAKSRLIRDLCEIVGITDPAEDGETAGNGYFEYLLTPFTEPGELFGHYDLAKLSGNTPELKRLDAGMMQNAEVVFLDEVFNGSSAILNAILAFMNERIFHDRGWRHKTRWRCLFGATNLVPQTAELGAVFDRFILRSHIDYVEAEPPKLRGLIEKGWKETYRKHKAQQVGGVLEDMAGLQRSLVDATESGQLVPLNDNAAYEHLTALVHFVRDRDISRFSNRRLIRLLRVMLIHRLYRASRHAESGVLSFGQPEFDLFWKYFIDDPGSLDPESRQQMISFGME